MIYNTSFMRKELRNAYMQQKFSRNRQFSLGLFLGLISFAIYFSLQTLKQSVVSDAAPQLMMPSYFSTLYIYLFVSLIFNVIFYITNYEYMTFIEVIRNRWYPLVQLGYKPTRLIAQKLIGRFVFQGAVYSIGFTATIFLSSFLKFPLVLDYIIPMYIMGLIDILILAAVSLTLSLFLNDITNARYIVGLLAVGLFIFKLASGYYDVLANRVLMSDLGNMLDAGQTVFMSVTGFLIAACVVICLVYGNLMARVYHPALLYRLPKLTNKQAGTIVLKSASSADSKKREVAASTELTLRRKGGNLPSIISAVLMLTVIVGMLGINIVVLAFGYASPERETSINGMIPYVFQSSTMEPHIMLNDLAIFQKVDKTSRLDVGDVLLFKDLAGVVNVAELTGYETDELTNEPTGRLETDVSNYVDERYRGLAAQTIERGQVYAVHDYNNRWLGAIILFANTILGRLIFLLIPTVMIFFYEPVIKFFRNISNEQQ